MNPHKMFRRCPGRLLNVLLVQIMIASLFLVCILILNLQLDNREHIRTEHFDKINWLPIDKRVKQCLSKSVFKIFSEISPQHMNKIYKTSNQNNTATRNSSSKLFQPLRTSAQSQKCLSYLGPLFRMVCQMMLNCQTM